MSLNFHFFSYPFHNKSSCSFIKYTSNKKNVLLTGLTHTRRLFYEKMFYQSNTQCISILILLFCLILRLVFLDVQIQCVFYSFHNKFLCFVPWENYFFFLLSLTIYFLFLCFCFKNLDLLNRQTTQINFSLSSFLHLVA